MKIWAKTKEWAEGKFLVVRRDGSVPHWPHFVLGARDPAAPATLRAYAKSYKLHSGGILEGAENPYGKTTFDEEYYLSILSLAVDFEDYRVKHGDSDPDAPPHRKDDPDVINAMRGQEALIFVRPDEGNAPKAKANIGGEMSAPPGFWMHETSGVLRPAVEAYLNGDELTVGHIAALRAYLRQWIAGPFADVEDLRRDIDNLTGRREIDNWLDRALARGIDPL